MIINQAYRHRKKGEGTWARQEGEGLQPSNAQSKECREHKPKDPCILHVARVKQLPERTAESDKRGGNGKCMKARKVMNLDRNGACTHGPGTTNLYPANIRGVGGTTGQGYERVWYSSGEMRKTYFGIPAQNSLVRNVLLG